MISRYLVKFYWSVRPLQHGLVVRVMVGFTYIPVPESVHGNPPVISKIPAPGRFPSAFSGNTSGQV